MQVTERQQAKQRGDKTYISSLPCKRLHNSPRQTSNGTCLQCAREAQRTHREDNKDLYKKKYHANRDLHVARVKRWRQENPERYKQISNTPRAKIVSMLASARTRAKKAGVEFSLTPEHIIIPTICPVLGIPIVQSVGRFSPNAPSLDRVNPSAGYTPDNVRIISWRANKIKTDATLDELEAVVKYVRAELIAHK